PKFSFEGKHDHFKDAKLAVNPLQRPHPPLWIETRDPATLEFCAREGINVGYFLVYPREDAAPRYRKYLDQWRAAGHKTKPHIAYSTVVYVDETDEKALARGLKDPGNAYRGFFPAADSPAALQELQNEHAQMFEQRGEPGAAETMRHLLDPQWLLQNDR